VGTASLNSEDGWTRLSFAAAVFCGSLLLFLAELIAAKELLPWFGGAANVWATCLVFFQVGLLAGYAFADVLARRFAPASQLPLLMALLALAGLTLPIVPAIGWRPAGAESPSLRVFGALATMVGLPFVLVAATSPLVQSWHAQRFTAHSPYRLFALSNLASMLALLIYPILIEPRVGTRAQAYAWSAGYVLWAALMLVCAWRMRASALPVAPQRPAPPADRTSAPGYGQYAVWAALAALGSFLLVAVTNYMTRDVAAIPLLWVVPLAVYLLTFIVSFQGHRWQTPAVLIGLAALALALYAAQQWYLQWPDEDERTLPIGVQIGILCAELGCACLFCHGRLAKSRPASPYLTRFYITVSLGGAVGATLIGVAAPALLPVDFDLDLGVTALAAALLLVTWPRRWPVKLLAIVIALATVCAAGLVVRNFYDGTVLTRRNFYAALRVYDWEGATAGAARSLSNGIILHGTQYLDPAARRRPTDYYGEASGVGHAMAVLHRVGSRHRIGVIGLGTGTLAAYGRAGDVIRFYELNPAVVDIARQQFTYLGDSAARIEIAVGDARLNLEREAPQRFDLLVVDAFSSDAIPVHLLTLEALDVYLGHLTPIGVLALHTSNRYIDLPPVLERLAQARNLTARLMEADTDDAFNSPSSWVLMSREARYFDAPELVSAAQPLPRNATRVWTDDFTDLLPFLYR
jgi:hypothetical protein